MVKEVIFRGREAAQAMPARADWAVISIHDYFQAPAVLQAGWHDILQLPFYDQELAVAGLKSFTDEQADAAVAFVEKVAPHVAGILVHCQKGESRSAAVAKYIAQRYQLDFPAQYDRFNQTVYRMLQERIDPR